MAVSPQRENGYTGIANELLREIYRYDFSIASLRVLLWVARDSYGWCRKNTVYKSWNVLAKEINMARSSVRLAIDVLLEEGALRKNRDGSFTINKNYEEWGAAKASPGQPVAQGGQPAAQAGVGSKVPKSGQLAALSGQPAAHLVRENITDKEKQIKKERKAAFAAPTPQEVVEYAKSVGYDLDGQHFCDYYTARGWKLSGNATMKDWKAAVRTWKAKDAQPAPDAKPKPAAPKCTRCKIGGLDCGPYIGGLCRMCQREDAIARGEL